MKGYNNLWISSFWLTIRNTTLLLSDRDGQNYCLDLAEAAKKVLEQLNTYITWDDNMLIGEINLEKDDLEARGFFQDQLVMTCPHKGYHSLS